MKQVFGLREEMRELKCKLSQGEHANAEETQLGFEPEPVPLVLNTSH